MFKQFISLLFIIISTMPAFASDKTFVSISPALTETIYALGAEENLLGVSKDCTYPKEAKNKEIIGDLYFINEERLLYLKPNYFLGLDSSGFILNKYKRFNIEPLCFKYPNIESIYENIRTLGILTGKKAQAEEIISFTKTKIKQAKENNKNPKKILYIIQEEPFMTIGKNSFITSIIEASGNYSVTSGIELNYPVILEEYAINQKPDIIVMDYFCNSDKRIKKLFKNTPVVKISKEQADIINRPSPRIYKSVEFFSSLH